MKAHISLLSNDGPTHPYFKKVGVDSRHSLFVIFFIVVFIIVIIDINVGVISPWPMWYRLNHLAKQT
jgi:hypothetical protein